MYRNCQKNIRKNLKMEVNIENKIFINIYKNNDSKTKKIFRKVEMEQIQFHFNIDGEFLLKFNDNYKISLKKK